GPGGRNRRDDDRPLPRSQTDPAEPEQLPTRGNAGQDVPPRGIRRDREAEALNPDHAPAERPAVRFGHRAGDGRAALGVAARRQRADQSGDERARNRDATRRSQRDSPRRLRTRSNRGSRRKSRNAGPMISSSRGVVASAGPSSAARLSQVKAPSKSPSPACTMATSEAR